MKDDGYGEIKYRAQHGEGLSLDKVRSGSRTIELRLRDTRHAKLEQILVEHGLKDTAEELEDAFRYLTAGMGYTVMDVNKIRGSASHASDAIAILISDYNAWHDRCKAKYLSPIMCKQVIIEGYSLNETDALNKMREGTAKKNMISCLALFSEMRGRGRG